LVDDFLTAGSSLFLKRLPCRFDELGLHYYGLIESALLSGSAVAELFNFAFEYYHLLVIINLQSDGSTSIFNLLPCRFDELVLHNHGLNE
jgi:hypothetical protein